MHKENLKEAEKVNLLQWHEAGYTGKGIKVMTFENAEKGHGDEHGYFTVEVFKQACPDAEIFEPDIKHSKTGTKCFAETVKQALDAQVDIIFNARHFGMTPERENLIQTLLDAGVIIVNAIGNDNKYVDDKTGNEHYIVYHNRNILQIGAVNVGQDDIRRSNYSNKGELLDYVAFTNIWTKGGRRFTGTSCATPWFAGVLGCFMQLYYEESYWDSGVNFMELVDDYLMDLGKVGRDDLYGKGMLVLPDVNEMILNNNDTLYTIDNIPTNTPHNRRPATIRTIKGICIHNTANPTSSALNERSWLTNPNNTRDASFNYVVDAKNIIQCIPDNEVSWHANDGKYGEGNVHYLSVEIAEGGNYVDNEKNAIRLIVAKLIEHNLTVDNIKPHKYFYSKKNCPHLILPYWNDFIDEIKSEYEKAVNDMKFSDVDENAWYAKAVETVSDDGIMIGYEDGTFKPDETITRKEVAQIIMNMKEEYMLINK